MNAFKGIRYARAERFAMPRLEPQLKSLQEVETAVEICPQNPSRLDRVIGRTGHEEQQSEDCLRVAVYTPSTEEQLPVLVWIHGGAYLTGSGLYPQYDATSLSEMGHMVVVCVSYRLGCFGFLHHPQDVPDNLGIADQVCALRWIKQNIHLFGGDADNVTLFGQSAGGYSVLHHIANVGEPLFGKAIIASAPFAAASRRKMSSNTRLWYRILGKDPRQCSTAEMLSAQALVARRGVGGMPFSAVGDHICAPRTLAPGLTKVKLWCQQDDALPFVPFRWLTGPVTRLLFLQPMKRYARHLQRKGVEASWSVRRWRHGCSPFGAVHCMELPLLFGCYDTWKDAPFMQGVSKEEYKAESLKMKTEIIAMIKG